MENSNVTPLVPKDKSTKEESSLVSSLSPREIVSELDRFVVGQNKAKKAVAVALRNRWRRQALKGEMKNEVLPKNILMIGPTGVGKTEISRRLSKLAEAPFVKVEATRFTEVGYVGRDVEQIVRDLIEIAIGMEKVKMRKEVQAQAQKSAEEKVLDALVGKKASLATRESFRKRLRNGDLDENEIEIAVSDTGSNNTSFEIPGMPGANVGMINIGEMIGKSMDLPIISPILIIPTLAPGIPGISNEVLFDPVSLTAISISFSSKSPFLSLFLKLSLVAKLAFLPTRASKTFSSADFCA